MKSQINLLSNLYIFLLLLLWFLFYIAMFYDLVIYDKVEHLKEKYRAIKGRKTNVQNVRLIKQWLKDNVWNDNVNNLQNNLLK